MSYTSGIPGAKLRLSSEKERTIDQIVDEADLIWKHARRSSLDQIRRAHPEFCQSYPIVVRYICQMRQYNKNAFRSWLLKIQSHPWLNESEYLDAQADYVVMLFRSKRTHANSTQISNLRINIRNILQQEHDQFKKYAEKYNAEVVDMENRLHSKNITELLDFISAVGEKGIDISHTLRVESDIDADTPPCNYIAQSFDEKNSPDMTAEMLLD